MWCTRERGSERDSFWHPHSGAVLVQWSGGMQLLLWGRKVAEDFKAAGRSYSVKSEDMWQGGSVTYCVKILPGKLLQVRESFTEPMGTREGLHDWLWDVRARAHTHADLFQSACPVCSACFLLAFPYKLFDAISLHAMKTLPLTNQNCKGSHCSTQTFCSQIASEFHNSEENKFKMNQQRWPRAALTW